MALTIPGTPKLRITTEENRAPLPVVLSAALTLPVCVAIDSTQNRADGMCSVSAIDSAAARNRILGFSICARGAGLQPWLANGSIVEGFTGGTPGADIYCGDDGAPTETAPAVTGSIPYAINAGDPAATVEFTVVVPPGAKKLSAFSAAVKTTHAANDTNYWTWAITNKGSDGSGSTAMLAASDANTTKATGGAALTAYDQRAFTLHGTAANLNVTPGQVLTVILTKTASAVTLDDLSMLLEFDGSIVARPIGRVLTATKALFFADPR